MLTLSQTSASAGKPCELFVTPDGSRLMLLPYGARVLGLYTPENDTSFYWSNPALENEQEARKLFGTAAWHNTGGDRTWIAPELDTFFPNADSSDYWQPRTLDMSDYAVERVGGGIELSRKMSLHLARPNRDASFRLSKWFGPAANPLRHDGEIRGVEYAGYTQRVTLETQDGPTGPQIGIWNIAQFPAGGQMLVPLYSKTTLQKCFGDMPDDRMTMEDHLLRIDVNFSGSHKIAVKAAALCGRTGYVYPQGNQWSLVIRNFFVNPSGDYIDVQRHASEDFGYGFQMCRVDEVAYGSFCEMEYHAPAIGSLPEVERSVDVSQIWAFRGDMPTIDAITQKLLGASLYSRNAT